MVNLEDLKAQVESKRASSKQVEEKLAELERQKSLLELNDQWSRAYEDVEKSILSERSKLQSFKQRIAKEGLETKRFFEGLDKEYFYLKEVSKVVKYSVTARVIKEEYITPETSWWRLIVTGYRSHNDKDAYNEPVTMWEVDHPYTEYKIKFKPFHAVEPPKGMEPFSQKVLEKKFNVRVERNWNGKWNIVGLGYDIDKAIYKTPRLITTRVTHYFKAKLHQAYNSVLETKCEQHIRGVLVSNGFIKKEDNISLDGRYRTFTLPNKVQVFISYTIDYNEGTFTPYVSRFILPTPDINTREHTMVEIISKLENLKVSFD